MENRPSFAAFAEAAQSAQIVPVGTTLHFDHETAISLADRFVHEENFFLLESATAGPGQVARYSFFGFDALWQWCGDLASARVTYQGKEKEITLTPGLYVKQLGEAFKSLSFQAPKTNIGQWSDLARNCGAVGYLSYDISCALEPSVGSPPGVGVGIPASFFFVPKVFFILDQLSLKLYLYVNVAVNENARQSLESLYREHMAYLKHLVKRLRGIHSPAPLEVTSQPIDWQSMRASVTKEQFFRHVETCLNLVRQGEIFQVQIGNRLSTPTEARPFDIFRHLRILNPSPYMFFYKMGKHHILGASPEMMVNVTQDRMVHRPIAGTRKRTWNAAKDQRMRHELVTSEKERAEHVMLVDLGRNDIGRVAAPGSVAVEELMTVEQYSHVFHMVSQVSGQLAAGVDAFDAMSVSFPNGTVSGAPKIRAMQIIYDLEKVRREFYAGSLALFDFQGDLKSTILIRTLHMADQIASTQASAGIVYDSVAEEEWLETRNKMAACVTAIQNTL